MKSANLTTATRNPSRKISDEAAGLSGQMSECHGFLPLQRELILRNRCGGITYKFCARVEMMSSVAD
jgi:hypothetical protein